MAEEHSGKVGKAEADRIRKTRAAASATKTKCTTFIRWGAKHDETE
jgi:hypothetical protein